MNITDELSHFGGVLSQSLRKNEPSFAEQRATNQKNHIWNEVRAAAKLLAIDCDARFFEFSGRGRGPASECLESICPCYHLLQVSLSALFLANQESIPLHGQKWSQWWRTRGSPLP